MGLSREMRKIREEENAGGGGECPEMRTIERTKLK